MPPDLPLTTRFTLGTAITPEQRGFLREHGFILFSRVASADQVAMLCDEMDRIAREWIAAGRTRVFGIPLFFGTDERGTRFFSASLSPLCFRRACTPSCATRGSLPSSG
jgi:hypothetical protein